MNGLFAHPANSGRRPCRLLCGGGLGPTPLYWLWISRCRSSQHNSWFAFHKDWVDCRSDELWIGCMVRSTMSSWTLCSLRAFRPQGNGDLGGAASPPNQETSFNRLGNLERLSALKFSQAALQSGETEYLHCMSGLAFLVNYVLGVLVSFWRTALLSFPLRKEVGDRYILFSVLWLSKQLTL